MYNELKTPRYIKIALDIAFKIYNGEFQVGEKLRGRSTLAGNYGVSPETIRRAAALLSDMDVVEVTDKSGIYIKSKEKANVFIQKFSTKSNITSLKKEIKSLGDEKKSIEKKIERNIESIIEYCSQFSNIGLFYPYEIEIPKHSHVIGNTISDTMFWQNTGATIIAVSRKGNMMLSPGPYFSFEPDDLVYFIGTEDTLTMVKEFVTK